MAFLKTFTPKPASRPSAPQPPPQSFGLGSSGSGGSSSYGTSGGDGYGASGGDTSGYAVSGGDTSGYPASGGNGPAPAGWSSGSSATRTAPMPTQGMPTPLPVPMPAQSLPMPMPPAPAQTPVIQFSSSDLLKALWKINDFSLKQPMLASRVIAPLVGALGNMSNAQAYDNLIMQAYNSSVNMGLGQELQRVILGLRHPRQY